MSSRRVAAVGVDGAAGVEVGCRRAQEEQRSGKVLRLAEPAQRHARQEANKELKRKQSAHEISEDDAHRQMDEVQKITDNFIHKVDELLKTKEHEVLEV